MKSFLLSALSHRYASLGLAALTSELPFQWLVWEPGAWAVPRDAKQTTVLTRANSEQPGGLGEALVMALAPARTGTGQLTFGRSENCALHINDATLSQLHLVFMREAGGDWTVRDAGSTNGSWVNEVRLVRGEPVTLVSGARLQAGGVHLSYYSGPDLFSRLQLEAARASARGGSKVSPVPVRP